MRYWTTLTASDGHELDAWLVMPEGAPKGAIVVIQEIFGVNDHIRNVVSRFAKLGYVALAPAIFDRHERHFEAGYTMEEMQRAIAFVDRLDMDKVLLDVAAAKATVSAFGKVGIVGYCLGGTVAWLGATRLGFDAAQCYYGGAVTHYDDETPACPVQMHYGEFDTRIPLSVGRSVQVKHPQVEVFNYPADHGFACDARGQFHELHATSHGVAWRRSWPSTSAEQTALSRNACACVQGTG